MPAPRWSKTFTASVSANQVGYTDLEVCAAGNRARPSRAGGRDNQVPRVSPLPIAAAVFLLAACSDPATSENDVDRCTSGACSASNNEPGNNGTALDGGSGTDAETSPDATPLDPSLAGVYIEAEEGTVGAPFAVVADPDASRGRYVAASGVPNSTEPTSQVTHEVAIPDAGDWFLWARLYAPTPEQDAVYLGFNDAMSRVFPAVYGEYTWVRLEAPATLSSGTHRVSLGHGEAGLRVDAFVLTTDPDQTPSAIPAAVCGNGCVESPEACEAPTPCCDATTCTIDPDCETGTVVVLETRKGFPDLFGEGAANISGGSGPESMKFFITSLADTDTATLVPAAGGVEAHYTGTFRGAMNLEQRRHIVPRVSGNIDLQGGLRVGGDRGNFTYHGHLAPEGGLAVTNNTLVMTGSNNLVFRHLRLRFGAHSILDRDDVLYLRGNQMAVDHVSLAWGADETFTIGGAAETTFDDTITQNTIIGQSRDGHATGTLIGWTSMGDNAHGIVSWHNNLYVGVTHRTPNFAGDSEMYGRIYNNVIYDWWGRLTNVVGAPTVDVGYNYYKMGPRYPNVPQSQYNQYQDLRGARPYPPSIYTAGNIMPGVLTDPNADNQTLWTYFGSADPVDPALFRATPLPIDAQVGYQPSSAEDAYQRNIIDREIGANRSTDANGNPVIGHDSVDEHYLTSIASGANARMDESDWIHPPIPDSPPFPDANWNGIADPFEAAHGITSADQVITDWTFAGYRVVNNAGYDAFEIYSAWVAGDFERLLP